MAKEHCKMVGCERETVSRGFCGRHYAQMQRGLIDENGGALREPKRVPLKFQPATCRGEGCADPVKTAGWCNKHYLRFRSGSMDENGKPLDKQRYWHNKGYRTYMRGYRKVMAAEGHPYADKDGYVLEHRLVMETILGRYLEPGEVVHHINGVRDDNRPENLQLRASRADHGHGHEEVGSVEEALAVLDRLVNPGMTGADMVLKKLHNLTIRLTLVV